MLITPAPAELDVTQDLDPADLPTGRLDILVNCAGVIQRDDEFQIPTFERVLDVNLTGTMRMCVACRPMLARARGSIVNIASVLSFVAGPRVPAYSASKGGIVQLTKSLAAAWGRGGNSRQCRRARLIRTPLTSAVQADEQRSAAILARTPLARWGEPGDIAGPVLFLCSQAAAFITGAVLPVDGGYLIS